MNDLACAQRSAHPRACARRAGRRSTGCTGGQPKDKDVSVQLLGINDFHGNLEPPTGSGGRIQELAGGPQIDAGGAVYLANQLRTLRQQNRNTLTVSAGDLIGASPLLSALFHDEPTIEAMNEMGLDLNAVGNHEFDEGVTELLRMQNGGCGPENSCPQGTFGGADFRFLAANVVYRDTGEPIFPPYAIRKFGNIKVGFIGMTLEGTPNIVSASGIQDVEFLDEAETANKYAAELRNEHGVRAIVVLLHEGGTPSPFAGIDQCNVAGAITDIVDRTSDAVDLFVTGHTHQPYVCIGGQRQPDRRPPGHERELVRPAGHQHRLQARPQDEGHQGRDGRQHDRHAHPARGAGHPAADRQLQHAGGPDREPAASAGSRPTSPGRAGPARRREPARQPDRRRAAGGHRRRGPR